MKHLCDNLNLYHAQTILCVCNSLLSQSSVFVLKCSKNVSDVTMGSIEISKHGLVEESKIYAI